MKIAKLEKKGKEICHHMQGGLAELGTHTLGRVLTGDLGQHTEEK